MSIAGLRLGAPGVIQVARPVPPRFDTIRQDVAGFVGVAPRGPVDEPTPVASWSEYRWLFGEGPGLLPWSVRAFFAQGGDRAYVCRVSPLPRGTDPLLNDSVALHRLDWNDGSGRLSLTVAGRNEGSWADALVVCLEFAVRQRFAADLAAGELELPDGAALPPGTLLRLRGSGLPDTGSLAWVDAVAERTEDARRRRVAVLGTAVPLGPGPLVIDAAVITATVTVADHDATLERQEQFADLGLRPDHPRYLARVLDDESRLVCPAGAWPPSIRPDPFLTAVTSRPARPGRDRWYDIAVGSFFGPTPPELLPVGGRETIDDRTHVPGVDAMALVQDVAILLAPDLMWSAATASYVTEEQPEPPRGSFGRCQPPRAPTTYQHPAVITRLDPGSELDEILARQLRLVRLAETQQRFVVLLDVPERLSIGAIARWRSNFDTSYAAAYHPWLGVVGDQRRNDVATFVPPSAFAAGIIAARERRLGIPWGPANADVTDAVIAATPISDAEHDALHLIDIDVFRSDARGIRLTSAHTLSRDPTYRQLSVRRLMTMLKAVLQRQSQWLVFEPHTSELRRQLGGSLTRLLRDLHRAGAFAGATEAESFFVRCDETVNTTWSHGLGRLVAEVGVAPAVPLEYLVLRVTQDAEGVIGVEG
jgi:hypothetical protein